MVTDKLIQLINDNYPNQLQKNMMIGFVERAEESQDKYREDRKLIEETANEKYLSEILLSTDDVKIYTIHPRRKDDEWDTKYPYRSIFLNGKGNWERVNTVSPTFDVAFLVYLQYKQLGQNSQFVEFAAKMLDIKL